MSECHVCSCVCLISHYNWLITTAICTEDLHKEYDCLYLPSFEVGKNYCKLTGKTHLVSSYRVYQF